jgi:hypothetical protein
LHYYWRDPIVCLLGLIGVGSPHAIARWPHPDAQLINKESLSAEKATNPTQIVASPSVTLVIDKNEVHIRKPSRPSVVNRPLSLGDSRAIRCGKW